MTKIDYEIIKNGIPTHNINWNKYNSENINWQTLKQLFYKEKDFIDVLFIKLTGKEAEQKERKLLLKSMMLSCMGTGHLPPSLMIPKIIASTTKDKKFAITNGLIGGLTALGTDHLGAIEECMQLMEKFKNKNNKKKSIKNFVNKKLEQNKKIKGFGHPLYKKDPRPEILITDIKKTYKKNQYLDIFNYLKKELLNKKNIHPNIDSALAVSYSSLGFEPEHGIYLSFISRSIGMVSHILEEFPEKPFSFVKNNLI